MHTTRRLAQSVDGRFDLRNSVLVKTPGVQSVCQSPTELYTGLNFHTDSGSKSGGGS